MVFEFSALIDLKSAKKKLLRSLRSCSGMAGKQFCTADEWAVHLFRNVKQVMSFVTVAQPRRGTIILLTCSPRVAWRAIQHLNQVWRGLPPNVHHVWRGVPFSILTKCGTVSHLACCRCVSLHSYSVALLATEHVHHAYHGLSSNKDTIRDMVPTSLYVRQGFPVPMRRLKTIKSRWLRAKSLS
ncbi:hypothetical protein ElyMa_001996200 [Elysia marginata]|uniref:Uncharacterized protein n=1 Tax=Elysia marginata TaxID=1093978 RepID=A0AAV4F347_9GAST|nr:hypothetical protein ElyMa_001996200 [Elysia marginata]